MSPLALLVLMLSASAVALMLPASTPAAGQARMSRPGTSDAAALRLLERADTAPARTAYSGVQFVSAWAEQGATGLVVQVSHRPGVGTAVRSEGNAHAPAADTYLPADARQPSLIARSGALSLLAASYSLTLAGTGRVAGRPAHVVEARRTGSKNVAGRFWLDRKTGLVLRREVYDERGRATRASAFVDLEVGRSAPARVASNALPSPWPHEVSRPQLPGMRTRGWHCPEKVAGTLELVDARRGGSHKNPILHLSYSDGLSSVSLFQQRGRLDAERLTGYRATQRRGGTIYVRDGVPARWVWSARGMVLTVVADAPARTVDHVVAALPAPDAPAGTWGRLGRGMSRVASWFNPFG